MILRMIASKFPLINFFGAADSSGQRQLWQAYEGVLVSAFVFGDNLFLVTTILG